MDQETLFDALDERTALLTLSHVVFKSGFLYDAKAIRKASAIPPAIVRVTDSGAESFAAARLLTELAKEVVAGIDGHPESDVSKDPALARWVLAAACSLPHSPGSRKQVYAWVNQAARRIGVAPDDLRKEVEADYKTGQQLFEKGNLTGAVARWEKVERLAPGYMSVRTYLVDAYKFLGVELYTQSRLADAVDVWKKAAGLDPDSSEIAGYIKRTESEIATLEELSYESR